MSEPWERGADRRQQRHRAVAVLNPGGMDDRRDQQPHGIGEDMSLAALDLLAGVVAARPAGFRRFHRLAVDHARRRARLAPGRLARRHQQVLVDPLPGAVVPPAVEPALHRRARREIPRQHPPLAAGRQHVEQRVHHRPQLRLARPSQPVWRRHERRDRRPFFIRRIACILQSVPPILRPSDFSPGHLRDSVSLRNTTESQPTEITQLIFGQALTGAVDAPSIHERVVDHDGVVALGAGGEQVDRRFDQLLDAADVLDRGRRQVGPGAGAPRALGPALHRLVDRLDPGLRTLEAGRWSMALAVEPVADADLDLGEAVEHVELGQRDAVDAVDLDRLADQRRRRTSRSGAAGR